MSLKKTLCIFAIVLLALPCLCQAEFYRYKDAGGVLRFTDNLAEVPIDQRPEMEQYKGVDASLTQEQKAAKQADKAAKAAVRQQRRQTSTGSTRFSSSDKAFSALKAQERALEKDGRELEAEQSALLVQKGKASTTAQINAVNKKIAQLNTRINAYEKKRQLLLKRIDIYNKKVNQESGLPDPKK